MRKATIPLVVELCAGMAALSLRVQAPRARPTVPRRGVKTGYADAILGLLGATPGQGADAFVWCEPDAGCRLALASYADADLRAEAADIVRGWTGDPRTVFEALRAEGPPKGVTAREVARWHILGAWSYRAGEPESGFNAAYVAVRPSTATGHGSNGRTVDLVARALTRIPPMPKATIHTDARTLPSILIPPGTLVYIDSDYLGTTPFEHGLSRAEVLDLARRWHTAGARVAVSETVRLDGDLPGWRAVDVTDQRVGQFRTFSRQKTEWVTLSP